MRKLLMHTLLLGFLVIFCSCGISGQKIGVDTSLLQEIKIDPSDSSLMLSSDSLYDKIDFIKLETSEECIVGDISQLFFLDTLMIVVDNQSTKSIFFFDMMGNYKYKIYKLGNGPGEYTSIWNVCLTPDNKQLVIYDNLQHRVLFYSINGEYVKTEKQPFMLDYFVYMKSGYKAFNVDGMFDDKLGKEKNKSLIVSTSDNKLVYGFWDCIYRSDFTYSKNRILRNFGDQTFFSPNISDTIYELTDESILAKYHINLGDFGIPEIRKISDKEFSKLLDSHFFFNGDFVELENFTYLNIMTRFGYPGAVYSHKAKKTFLQSGFGKHPLFIFLNNQVPVARFDDNSIVIQVPSYNVLSLKNRLCDDNLEYKSELDLIYQNMNENSNPVLFIYRLNKNLGL